MNSPHLQRLLSFLASPAAPAMFSGFSQWKERLALPQPGSPDSLHREARNVSNANHLFEGGKADLAKGLSPNFQVSHSFQLASNSTPASYHFGALYATERHLLHGMIGGDGTLQGKWHWSNLGKSKIFRLHHQISPSASDYDMLQLEGEIQGKDWSATAKAFNPTPFAPVFGGIFTLGILQSLAQGFAVGIEGIWQRASSSSSQQPQEFGISLLAKAWDSNRILAVTVQQLALVQASYWQKVGDKIELGTELQACVVGKRDGVASVGCKLDFRQATVRGQLDTLGKVALVLEEKLAPGFSFLLSGELDHFKGISRFGVGINMES